MAFAERAGAARLATGHYARLVERDGKRLVARAADPQKDQSYMLATVAPELLERLWFPLGDQTKAETRARGCCRTDSRLRGAPRARRPASSPATTTAASSPGTGSRPTDGPVLDEAGAEVGRHDGFWRFTPGQRRGLGVAAAEPLYALRTDAATNAVVVGPREALARRRVSVRGRLHVAAERGEAKLRYRSPAVGATILPRERGFELELDEPAYGVAPGQTAVVYDGDAVIGAGVITSASDT